MMVQYIQILFEGACTTVGDTKKEYVVCPDEMGSINISEDVVAAIAVSAALEVDGVGELDAGSAGRRGKKRASRDAGAFRRKVVLMCRHGRSFQ